MLWGPNLIGKCSENEMEHNQTVRGKKEELDYEEYYTRRMHTIMGAHVY